MWRIKSFQELTTTELYTYLQLRVNVFIVEQSCPYPELDGYDMDSYHFSYIENDELLAYARVLPSGVKYNCVSIGRVIVDKKSRGRGLAKQLMEQAISFIHEQWPIADIQLQAQAHLKHFYGSFGFEAISDEYDEDGIPHVDMLKKAVNL
ncbi:GNAT family N-acetyltransferase [Paenisporosarcina antarctica]|uniref:Protein ElaA n=1 Tax=Paenisporosarcina antarctica TaxID=417367 RepID=A0A4P6ZUL3_9BACL|nr:GNAT family N-acetyltransferase [Paenisporosarcina antarctica]QBP40011.1 GNAT family N-acetyltransferase [Paenisporosarcina antarctica]